MDVYITFPVLYETEEYRQASDLGLRTKPERYVHRDVTFFSINAISPTYAHGGDHTVIHSNGDEFIVPIDVDTVNIRIFDTIQTADEDDLII